MRKLIDPLEVAMAELEKTEKEEANLGRSSSCPVCGTKMQQVLSLGHAALFCATHNMVLPAIPE